MREVFARLIDELPGERPDGQTMAATLVALVIVLGLSASVLGSRGGAWRASLAPAAVQNSPGSPASTHGMAPTASPAAQCPTGTLPRI